MKKTTKKTLKGFVLGVIITTIFMSTVVGAQVKNTIDVIFNSINISVNGEDKDINNFLYKGRTYVPLRTISEIFDKEVTWDGDTNTASVDDNEVLKGNLPTELDIVSHEYRAIWKENYKYDTPILINNLNEFKSFLSNHPMQSANDDILEENYDDEFFNHSVIYAYVKSEGSGSVKLTVKKANIDGDILRLFMERKAPEIGTTDMATRVCLFGIKRNDIKNIQSVEGIISDIPSE